MSLARLLSLFALLVALTTARPADAADAAEVAFAEAQELYAAGRFEDAAAAFQRAHGARPLPLFHYNTAACFHMRGKAGGGAGAYREAVAYYGRYLAEDPAAPDKAQIEQTIAVLQGEIALLAAAPVAPSQPSAAVVALGDAKVRGVVVIESNPSAASIYLGAGRTAPFARTPWSGELPAGTTEVTLEARGYVSRTIAVAPADDRLSVYSTDLAIEDALAVLVVEGNVPGARVYLGSKDRGVVGTTPYQTSLPAGPVTVIIAADGYDDYEETLAVVGGKTYTVTGTLAGAPVGYLTIGGEGILRAQVFVDGELVCDREACRKGLRAGTHTIRVTRPGAKPFTRRLEVQPKVETTMKLAFAPVPSRGDAIVTYVLSGVFAGAGVGAFLYGRGLERDLDDEAAAGMPAPADDPRRDRADYARYGAYGAWGLSAVTLLTAIYYTFRDKGPPTSARVDSQALEVGDGVTVRPIVAPGHGGLALALDF